MGAAVALKMRSEEEIRSLIRSLVRELAPQPDGLVAENPRLVEQLGYHSLALLELAFTLEDEFGLEPIDQESAKLIVTARDVEEFVIQRVVAARADPSG
jgi:acyl carrier protein